MTQNFQGKENMWNVFPGLLVCMVQLRQAFKFPRGVGNAFRGSFEGEALFCLEFPGALGNKVKKKIPGGFSKKYFLKQYPAATHCPPPQPSQGKLSVKIASLLKIYSPCVGYLYLNQVMYLYPDQSTNLMYCPMLISRKYS